jgi:hypothetical protein
MRKEAIQSGKTYFIACILITKICTYPTLFFGSNINEFYGCAAGGEMV